LQKLSLSHRECVRNLDLRVQVHPGELWFSKQWVHIVLEASKSQRSAGSCTRCTHSNAFPFILLFLKFLLYSERATKILQKFSWHLQHKNQIKWEIASNHKNMNIECATLNPNSAGFSITYYTFIQVPVEWA
jgi:hypothetical protein